MKRKPITFFVEKGLEELLTVKLKTADLSKEEYLTWLIENAYSKDGIDSEANNEKSSMDIINISEQNQLIIQYEARTKELEQRLSELEDYPILNRLFRVIKGRSFIIKGYSPVYEMKTKADFLKFLVYNFYAEFDPDDFGLDEDWEENY